MTREEYEKLLQSDYWKGYSYSLIKERNFTCEDCGRSFVNERNKLQVHHLVYRDVNPWSYNPDEVVVLCKECHQKRHGVFSAPTNDNSSVYTRNYTSTVNCNTNSSYYPYTVRKQSFEVPIKKKTNWKKRLLIASAVFVCVCLAIEYWPKSFNSETDYADSEISAFETNDRSSSYNTEQRTSNRNSSTQSNKVKEEYDIPDVSEYAIAQANTDEFSEDEVNPTAPTTQNESNIPTAKTKDDEVVVATNVASAKPKSRLESIDERIHQNAVNDAKRAGVSTEGSTSDIMERIIHQNAVNDAKRAGVSTEGSTSEIMERIIHKNTVEQAKRMGISTE